MSIQTETIETALDGLLKAIFAEEERQRSERSGPLLFEVLSIADLRSETLPTRAESAIMDLARDPVGEACRQGVRQCGEMLFKIGGADLMHAAIERVAEMDERRYGSRLDIMDKHWNAIGGVWWS